LRRWPVALLKHPLNLLERAPYDTFIFTESKDFRVRASFGSEGCDDITQSTLQKRFPAVCQA
jgi:hypothetical protein